ncbi:MAG: hypothetical protein K0U59_06450 [Gammaproteobacteria bacterium]|nr:hypothetical protein [Gammaproteobacteria bacterium]
MKRSLIFIFIVFSAVLVGCAGTPQMPVSINSDFWQGDQYRVGVVMSSVPEVSVTFPGADCLLCLGVATVANSSIKKHFNSLNSNELEKFHQEIAALVEQQGMPVVVIDEVIEVSALPKYNSKIPNYPKKDFKEFATKYDITHLLVVEIGRVGITRSYASYVPTSAPMGTFVGSSYMVNLSDNSYTWYNPIELHKSVSDGVWDEPPTFPGLTNTYYQAIEEAKESIRVPLVAPSIAVKLIEN